MAICDISPPDFTTELGKVRYYSGDRELNTEGSYIIPDDVIRDILDDYTTKTSMLRIYYTTLDVILFMKSCFAPFAARSREREGSVEVELYGKERYQSICDLYDFYKKNPDIIVKDAVKSPIIIGGVSITKYCNVVNNSDSLYSGYSVGSNTGLPNNPENTRSDSVI